MSEPTATEIIERINSLLPKWRAWFPDERSSVEIQRCELLTLTDEIDSLRQQLASVEAESGSFEQQLEKANSKLQTISDMVRSLQDDNAPSDPVEAVDYLTSHTADGWLLAEDRRQEIAALESQLASVAAERDAVIKLCDGQKKAYELLLKGFESAEDDRANLKQICRALEQQLAESRAECERMRRIEANNEKLWQIYRERQEQPK